MRIAYLDTISGISGDMTLGAFIAAGVSIENLKSELQKLGLSGFELRTEAVTRKGIAAIKLTVEITDQPKYHRHLKDIHQIIGGSSLNQKVKENAKKIFYELVVAEASVHNSTIEKIHFHEVGALDAIVDIVGTAICLDLLHIERIYSSPIKLGSSGFANTEHGKMPIPTPATVELLKDYPIVLTDIPFELTTPTGAAIIKALSGGIITFEKMKVQKIGYGAGSRDMGEIPNLLRLFVAELLLGSSEEDSVIVETNIDDMNPEIYPYVIEKLLEAGAHDAYLIPIIMKKGRPGILLSALTSKSNLNNIAEVFFKQTTTLGLRIKEVGRKKLLRSSKLLCTSLGEVKVKVVIDGGRERIVPEFEECKRIANHFNIPLIEVYKIIEKEIAGKPESPEMMY
ncbi:MAG: nickel pincer cofactor biosynthesis protein LarC [Bacteroidota bacterium]|nr:nickel pincer cofactor biosynthesis protein LarC [Bacteroidota bacterium]